MVIGVENAHKYGHINYPNDYLNEFWSHYLSKQFLKAAVVAVSLIQPYGTGAYEVLACVCILFPFRIKPFWSLEIPDHCCLTQNYTFSSFWMELSGKHFKNVILPKVVVWRVELRI